MRSTTTGPRAAVGRCGAVFASLVLATAAAGSAGAAVVADPVLFNAASNVVADGDQPPGLVVGIVASSTQSNADDPEGAFGNADGPVEPDTFIFGDFVGGSPDDGDQVLGNGDEIVDSLEWQTIGPVTIAGYRLQLTQLDAFGRKTELVRFLVDGVERDFFDNDSATGATNAVVNVIDRLLATVVTGQTFRLELTRASNGPRITEIDALVEASEDPQININVAGPGTNPMLPSEMAGAPGVRDDNWTNLAGTNLEAGPIQVLGGDGLPVPGALASWTGFGQGDFIEEGGGTDDGHMFSSLFDARSYPAVDVTVTGVPYPLYDVYAYHQGGAPPGLFRVARFSIGETDLFSLRPEDFEYVESASTTDLGAATDPGTYVVFRGLTDPAFTLTVGGGSASDGFQRARFSGLQIVEATTSTSTTTSTSSSTTTTTSSSTSTVPTSVTTTSTSSSTSSTAPSTTTSTLPADAVFPPGRKLLVKQKKSGAQRLQLLVKSPEIAVDAAADPPCRIDGELVIEAAGGGAPAVRFALDADLWKPIKAAKPEKGCKYRKGPVVATVLLKAGKMLEVVANAADLGVPLGSDPRPVRIEVRHGSVRHCVEFGGAKAQHRPDKKLLARNAEGATACPAGGSPSGAFVAR